MAALPSLVEPAAVVVLSVGLDRYSATIGSDDNPSPSDMHKVNGVARNPPYTYNPKINFQQGNNKKIMELPSGPNNPVGTVWIDLSEPTYGIHGTPAPSLIDKAGSHGCIRLTNWDGKEWLTHASWTNAS